MTNAQHKKCCRNNIGVVLIFAVLTGCVSSNVSVDKALSGLSSGDDAQALTWAENLQHSSYSKQLGYVEAGRVRMLSGDFLGSSTNFAKVIDQIIETTESGPAIRLGDVGANVLAGTVTDDRMRTYTIPAYEFIQALHYQLLNHLFLGNPEAAVVEARRAVFAQEQIAEKYGKAASASADSGILGTVDQQMQNMAPVIEQTRSSFENGLVWYFCGLLLEQDNDIANAALCYQKAWELTPGNVYVQKDFLRLIRTQNRELYNRLITQTKVAPATLQRSKTEIVVVVEEGFISQRQSVKIPLPIGGTLTSVDFPVYHDPVYAPMTLDVRQNDTVMGFSEKALSMQALAYRDLKEKMPGIVVRNVTRVTTRIVAQQVANQAGDVAKFSVMAFNVLSTAINKADIRAWYTLPQVTHLYRGAIKPGEHLLQLRNQSNGMTIQVPLTVANGETRVVWVAELGGNARVATVSLNGKGGALTYQVCDSLLTGPRNVKLSVGLQTNKATGVK